jgi:DNA-binding protein HU-beta
LPGVATHAEKNAHFCAMNRDRDGESPVFLLVSRRSIAVHESSSPFDPTEESPMATSKAATGKAATPNTVTLKHLGAALADSHEIAKKQAEAILNDLVALVTKHLKKGDRIRIVGLGILQVRRRAARMGRNPATGEPIKIKASKKVAFRAAKDLKAAI